MKGDLNCFKFTIFKSLKIINDFNAQYYKRKRGRQQTCQTINPSNSRHFLTSAFQFLSIDNTKLYSKSTIASFLESLCVFDCLFQMSNKLQ